MSEIDDLNTRDELVPVVLPSGARFSVHKTEEAYFNERVKRYESDNKFTNIADLQDLDRVVMWELFIWRYGTWMSQQRDYWGDGIDEVKLQKSQNEMSRELRLVKSKLGVDREAREKLRGDDSFPAYLEKLLFRAGEFGYNREKQLDKALELFNSLKAIVTLYKNCDDRERREMRCTLEDVVRWIDEVAIPEYDTIDAHFRKNKQRYWIRQQ
jgi:hypothetical protein